MSEDLRQAFLSVDEEYSTRISTGLDDENRKVVRGSIDVGRRPGQGYRVIANKKKAALQQLMLAEYHERWGLMPLERSSLTIDYHLDEIHIQITVRESGEETSWR